MTLYVIIAALLVAGIVAWWRSRGTRSSKSGKVASTAPKSSDTSSTTTQKVPSYYQVLHRQQRRKELLTTVLVVVLVVAVEGVCLVLFADDPMAFLEKHYRWLVGVHAIGFLGSLIPVVEKHTRMGYIPSYLIVAAMMVVAVGTVLSFFK